ncbi:MAG: type II toxin-antitoxin system HicB family antitoxin [Candidatus Accumulibacter sp.]|uniref:Type II toxin-antitoxin system HicB family antitoxin n=1 Tax=Candidatus Accumulibacter proximus TaxID=2954385 RepID=A0A935UFW3_9PROT|nr:type II toxin-antitoxin system HicB family antitoxin [Candidatus Accumulibacter proximus]
MRYAIVIEKAESNFSGYVPDLPGCVATGATVEETENELLLAIQFHLDGLREDGLALLLQKASWSICLSPPNPSLQGTRRKRRVPELQRWAA